MKDETDDKETTDPVTSQAHEKVEPPTPHVKQDMWKGMEEEQYRRPD